MISMDQYHTPGFFARAKSVLCRKKKRRVSNYQLQSRRPSNFLSTAEVLGCSGGLFFALGVHVCTGAVMAMTDGPLALVAVSISALCSFLSGMCTAEFANRVPKQHWSFYSYTYISMGELIAYVVGWMSLLVNISVLALLGRGASCTMDYLLGNPLRSLITEHAGVLPLLGSYPDILSPIFILLSCLLAALGLRAENAYLHVFNLLNALFTLAFVGIGAFFAKSGNWQVPDTENLSTSVQEMVEAAASFVFVFGVFDSISRFSEQSKNPVRCKPLTTLLSVVITGCSYIAVVVVILFMPNSDPESLTMAPLPALFSNTEMSWVKYVLGVGAFIGLAPFLIEATISTSRTFCDLAKDGLVITCCTTSEIDPDMFTARGSIVFVTISAMMSCVLETTWIMKVASMCVMVLNLVGCVGLVLTRYEPDDGDDGDSEFTYQRLAPEPPSPKPAPGQPTRPGAKRGEFKRPRKKKVALYSPKKILKKNVGASTAAAAETTTISDDEFSSVSGTGSSDEIADDEITDSSSSDTDIDAIVAEYQEKIHIAALTRLSNESTKSPTSVSSRLVTWAIVVFTLWALALSIVLAHLMDKIAAKISWVIAYMITLMMAMIITIVFVAWQPQVKKIVPFSIPVVPWTPMMVIMLNLYLMTNLNQMSWTITCSWLFIGILLYVCHGAWHSKEQKKTTFSIPENNHIKLKPLPKKDVIGVCSTMLIPGHRLGRLPRISWKNRL